MLNLPTNDHTVEPYRLRGEPLVPRAPKTPFTRVAFAAAHLVSDPLRERDPWDGNPAIDWEGTLRFRHSLWDQGLGLAEAMDTAQRGMGVDWPTAKELIERTMRDSKTHPLSPRVACGASTDGVPPDTLTSAEAIEAAYAEQMEAIERAGGQVIIMASRAFPTMKADGDTYARVYDRLLEQAAEPAILHWLGDMFDPALDGYWGADDVREAADNVLAIIERNRTKVDGIKVSLLEQSREEALRARLPEGVRLYTGDDFNYVDLIEGDATAYSDALLGIFAAIAPAAAQGLEALARGDHDTYRALMEPTVPLSREIFRAPTRFYKAGIAFLAWLNGTQEHFIMPGGLQSSREITYYAEVFRLADAACLLQQPELAEQRMRQLTGLHGIG